MLNFLILIQIKYLKIELGPALPGKGYGESDREPQL
jgi:hypothetical protein